MAVPPVKSQPLHNFSLPHLKWAHKNSPASSSQHHRFRRRDSPDQLGQSYPEPDSDAEARPTNPKQQPTNLPSRNDPVSAAIEEGNGEAKPWNLRPRKEVIKAAAANPKKETRAENDDNKISSNNTVIKSQRLRGIVEGGPQNGGVERKGKRKIWISLSKEEIEEDIYALTGGKPSRRPRKWPKNVQKQLDVCNLELLVISISFGFGSFDLIWKRARVVIDFGFYIMF